MNHALLPKEFDLFRQFFDFAPAEQVKFPKSNIYIKQDDSLVFEFALAGYSTEDISILMDENKLFVQGKKEDKENIDIKKSISHNIAVRNFEVSYVVPNVYVDSEPQASFDSGILKITIPRRAGSEKKKIEIKQSFKQIEE